MHIPSSTLPLATNSNSASVPSFTFTANMAAQQTCPAAQGAPTQASHISYPQRLLHFQLVYPSHPATACTVSDPPPRSRPFSLRNTQVFNPLSPIAPPSPPSAPSVEVLTPKGPAPTILPPTTALQNHPDRQFVHFFINCFTHFSYLPQPSVHSLRTSHRRHPTGERSQRGIYEHTRCRHS